MDELGWEISKSEGLVVVRGVGVFNHSFITSFRQAMRAEGAVGYGKLFNLGEADIQLCEDPQAMTGNARPVSTMAHGPIAIVLGHEPPPLLLDMAVLLKNRIGFRRRLRLFTDEAEARQWLSSEAEIADLSGQLSHLLPRSMMHGNLEL